MKDEELAGLEVGARELKGGVDEVQTLLALGLERGSGSSGPAPLRRGASTRLAAPLIFVWPTLATLLPIS